MISGYIGAGTAELRAALPDLLQKEMFGPYGQRGFIVRQREPRFGELERTEARSDELSIILQPAERRVQQAAAGAGLPIPGFTAYILCRDAPNLDVPGFVLEIGGERYYPIEDVTDEGMQGVVWSIMLRGPGEVGDAVSP